MAVYRPTKDSRVWWYDFIFEAQRVRESAKTRSKTIAKEAERARRRELEESYNGIKRRDRAKLFSVAADEWFTLKSLTLAASSQRIERDNLKHLRPHFEKRLATDIQAKDVSRYQQDRLAEKASPKTINLEVGTLRAILRHIESGRRFSRTFGCSRPSTMSVTRSPPRRKPHYFRNVSTAVRARFTLPSCWR
jgi:hypothetical protein